jgi:Na+/H+ antiporter NhaC
MEHPFGPWSLLPPVVAIALAIITRRVVVSILAGVACGSIVLYWGALGAADSIGAVYDAVAAMTVDLLEGRLWESLADGDHLRVFAFTILMGAMVGVINRCGGMHGVVDSLGRFATTRRRGQLTTWALGMIVFFDDYANTLLLGSTMRPLTDRLKISREKLAYLVDSTAAPVAGLAVISTWVATEIGYIKTGFDGLAVQEDAVSGFGVFVETIPYRFYVLLALVFVVLVASLRRDFGPMLRAERDKLATGTSPGQSSEVALQAGEAEVEVDPLTPRRWYNSLLPVLSVIVVTALLLLITGRIKVGDDDQAGLWTMFSQGDSYVSLFYGALVGLIVAAVLSRAQRILSFRDISQAAARGALFMVPALAILWAAWALADVTGKISPDAKAVHALGTANFLGDQLAHGIQLGSEIRIKIPLEWMPTAVFIAAAAVAFSTGTSWGTMALLVPLSIQVTHGMLSAGNVEAVSAHDPILLATIGSVLAGAIFGDHCSPISDTTVLSSRASGCDHMAHVWTQMPYALVVGGVSILFGTIPVGFGAPVWPLLLLGVAALVVWLLVVGKKCDDV